MKDMEVLNLEGRDGRVCSCFWNFLLPGFKRVPSNPDADVGLCQSQFDTGLQFGFEST